MDIKKQGFTLVELLMAAVVMAVLVTAIGSVMYYSYLGWLNNTRSVNMKRDAYIAMEQIAREIRNSDITDITHDSSGIYFSQVSPARTYAINILAADIAVFPNVNISGFTAQSIGDAVEVSFTLFTDGNTDQNKYEMTVKTRN
ncbi:MAG: type II secretion system protein [Pontiella sp.]